MAQVLWDDQQQQTSGPTVVWDDAPAAAQPAGPPLPGIKPPPPAPAPPPVPGAEPAPAGPQVAWDDGMSVSPTAYGRIFDAGRQAFDGILSEPLGVSRESLGPLANQTPAEAANPILGPARAITETLIRSSAAAGDLAMRGISAVTSAGIAAGAQTLREFGVSDTTANKFVRDAHALVAVAGGGEYPLAVPALAKRAASETAAEGAAGAARVEPTIAAEAAKKAELKSAEVIPLRPEAAQAPSSTTGLGELGGAAQAIGANLRDRMWAEYSGTAQLIDPVVKRAPPGMSREQFIQWVDSQYPPAKGKPAEAAPTQGDLFDHALNNAVKELPPEQQAAAKADVAKAMQQSTEEHAKAAGLDKIPPEGITEPRLVPDVHKKVADAGLELLTAGGVRRDPSLLISDQMMDLLSTQRLTSPEINAILKKHDLSAYDLAEYWRVDIKKAAQDMQRLSMIEQRVRGLAKQNGAEEALIASQDAAGVNARGLNWWRRIDNIRRGLLVTQLATSMRNFATQTGRLGLDALTNTLDNGMRKVFAPGTEATAAPDAFEALMRVFISPRKTAKQTDAILSAFPKQQDRLFLQYASDINTAGAGKLLGHAERGVQALNIANRFQEYLIRRAVFAASLDRRLAKNGLSLDGAIKNRSLGSIPREDIAGAVDDALVATFGKDFNPHAAGFDGAAGSVIRAVNKVPGLTYVVPFPRFLANAIKYQFEYSPLGYLSLLTKEERASVMANGLKGIDYGKIAKASTGTAMYLAAYQLRNSQYAGERWYEVRLPDGRDLDMRPYAPFSSFLFWADLAKRMNNDTLDTLTAQDIISGSLAANFRAGTGLYMLDQLSQALAGLPHNDRVMQDFAGKVLAGYAVPLQQLKDFAAGFDQNEAIIRSGREGPYYGGVNWGEVIRNIPYAGSNLSPAYSPYREGPLQRDYPLQRQLTGIVMNDPKNVTEREIDRLGIQRYEFYPRTGDPTADSEVTQIMGLVSNRVVTPLVQSPNYQQLGNRTKSYILSRVMDSVRRASFLAAKARNPIRFAKVQIESMPEREQRMLNELSSGKFQDAIDSLSEAAEQ